MDRGAKIILAAALAIIYPLMIYFGTALAIPDKDVSIDKPERPTCDRYSSYKSSNIFEAAEEDACELQWDYYYDAQDEYYDEVYANRDEDRKLAAYRAITMLVIAVFTLIGSIKIDIKELAGGLILGSAAMVVFSVLYIAFQLDTLPFTQLVHLLIVGTFVAMTYFLKYIEDSYPESTQDWKKPEVVQSSDQVQAPTKRPSYSEQPQVDEKSSKTPPPAEAESKIPPTPQTDEPRNEEQQKPDQ